MIPGDWTRLAGLLQAHAPHPQQEPRPEHRLVEDLGFDSLALAKLVVALEAEFAIELPGERLHELRTGTAGDVAALLAQALAA